MLCAGALRNDGCTKGVFLCIVVTVDRLLFEFQIRVLWFLHFSFFFFFDQDKSGVVPRSERVPAGMCPTHFQASGTSDMSCMRSEVSTTVMTVLIFWFGVKSRDVLSCC